MYSNYLCFYFPNPATQHKLNRSQVNLQDELVGVYLLLWSRNIARLNNPAPNANITNIMVAKSTYNRDAGELVGVYLLLCLQYQHSLLKKCIVTKARFRASHTL